MSDDYDPAAIRSLEGMTPLRQRPRGHAEDDLSEGDRIALEIFRLGVRANVLAAAGDPGAAAAQVAYRKAEAEAIEAGHVLRRVDADDLRTR